MARPEHDIASNVPCTNNRGVYDAFVHYFRKSGTPYPPFTIDMGHSVPDLSSPHGLLGQIHERVLTQRRRQQKVSMELETLAAVSISRICFSRQHNGLPMPPEDVSRRRELVANIFAVADGAEVAAVHTSQRDDYDENGQGALKLLDSHGVVLERAVFLPAYSSIHEPHPVVGGMPLNVPGRHLVYGAWRLGLEDSQVAVPPA
jgi:hypothetical protein